MAIVFVSPKQRQKMFFLGITILFLLFLSVIGTIVFFSKPKPTTEQVFISPKIDINFKILDLDQVKESLLMEKVQKKFTYSATTEKGKQESGSIFADSIEEARKKLEDLRLISVILDEVLIGRENPFAPYYAPSISTK